MQLGSGERLGLAAIVAAAFAVRLAFVVVVPPLQAPDERAHELYVEHVARTRELPVQPRLDPVEAMRFWPQYYQPPLAYLLFVPTWIAAAGAPEATQLRLLRAQNAAYGAATAAIAFLVVAALTSPRDPRRGLAACAVAFLPGFVAKTSAVNNDALASLLAAAVWLPLLSRSLGSWRPWLAGTVFGAAALAKLTVLPLAPMLVLVPLLRGRREWRSALREGAIAGGVALSVLLPWLIRNAIEYGSPLAIGSGSFTLEQMQTFAGDISQLGRPRPENVARQFLGAFGVFQTIHWVPLQWGWGGLIAFGILGFVRRGRAESALDRITPIFLTAFFLSVLGLSFFATRYLGGWQGRYLFPALVPIAALVGDGGARWLPSRRELLFVALFALTLLSLDLVLAEKLRVFFANAPPLRWRMAAFL